MEKTEISQKKKIYNLLHELIIFFVKENYKAYLLENEINIIPDNELRDKITEMYFQKKDNLKPFLKSSLQEILKEDYIGDLMFENMCTEIFSDDDLAIEKVYIEIDNYQKNM
jgi:hypothetical protein